ncbi:MAG: 2,3-diaminopropionate biosynthesis protein SbnA [Exilibacterium sp.]
MIHRSIVNCIGNTPLVSLDKLFSAKNIQVYAKLEMLNPGGSVKDRPAKYIIEEGLRDGTIPKGAHLIESTSGNLGVALALLCRVYELKLTCVVDPKASKTNLKIMEAYGVHIEMVTDKDAQGGYLESRIRKVKELLGSISNSVWVNQYANARNWESHYHGEGHELIEQLPQAPDYLVVGVSTSGTILGISRRLREAFPKLRVIGVDAVGSVLFGPTPGTRELPGIGASRVPERLVREEIDDGIYVNDLESCVGCLDLLASEGIFAGGSSGSVVAAICKLIPEITPGSSILTLFPDRGDRYLDLVYSVEWRTQLKDSVQRRNTAEKSEVVWACADADQVAVSTVIL